MAVRFHQLILRLTARQRGFHLITNEIIESVPQIHDFRTGVMHLFLQHTSASITINENADPDVRIDLEASINALVPESFPYSHTIEGPDDMPAHVKSSLVGCCQSIPIGNGGLLLGTWQGIYLAEHREAPSSRRLVVTLWGEDGR